ncbi:hypothetical protein NL676_012767 [Syzygium grande]|nr:hypothetical protein NL676_012767 [Syzygium grande]
MKHRDSSPDVVVTEARDRIDGNITTVERDGYLWDEGPNKQERNRQLTKPITAKKMETRKVELETNLATNLKRQKQEYEAIISSSETDLHENEAESKR